MSFVGRIIAVLIPAFIGLAVLAAIWSYTTVDAGHVGVVKRFGAVTGETFSPGLHWKIPLLENVQHEDVRISSVDAQVSAGSRDQQDVQAVVSVQYSLNHVEVPNMINNLGTRSDLEVAILENAIQESVKAVTARYTAEELLTKRSEVKIGTSEAVIAYIFQALKEKKLGDLVRIANIGVKNIEFSEEFNKAIEAKVKTQQQAEQAKAEKEKRITNAEAANAEIKLQAEAEAYRVIQEAEARAAAIRQEGEALAANPGIIELRATEKWNGVLPIYNGVNATPFLNLTQK